jgi:putative Mn2+ efflux pump MntP
MTLLGWAAGTPLIVHVARFSYWLAFFILLLVSVKMIVDGVKDEECKEPIGTLQTLPLIVLSITTNIDALAVGVSFAFLQLEVLIPALIIGIIAFIMSFAGVFLGNRLKSCFGKRFEIVGGFILITIGLTIIFAHLSS